jgi:predicted ATPase
MDSAPPITLGVFVGRAPEMQGLHAAVEAALAGRGRCVLLSGEPGIGKTRTAEELANVVRQQGGRVLWGRCYEAEGAPAFWPWVQVLRAGMKLFDTDALRDVLAARRKSPHPDPSCDMRGPVTARAEAVEVEADGDGTARG